MNPVLRATSCFSNLKSIPMLNGSNFSEWKEHLLLVLALMDLDVSLREDRPDSIRYTYKTDVWDRSNRVCMMFMKIRIPQKFRCIVPEDVTTAKEYLAAVEKCYKIYEESEIDTVIYELSLRKKNPFECVREYIMMKMCAAAKLKKLGMHIPDNVVADMILESLPSEYDQLKKTYSSLKANWSTHELISHCVLEEESLKWDKKKHGLVSGNVICGKKRKNYEE